MSRDESMEEIKMEEMKEHRARERESNKLTRIIFGAQVIVAKASNVPIAVIFDDETGIHLRGITDALHQDWSAKNFVMAQEYVESLCQTIAKEDANEFNV
jgi:hypothetical protein